MKLSNERTADLSPSHVDLDAVMAVGRELSIGRVSAHEARVATALILNPELSGFRSIEQASGLCMNTLLKTIPADGESSTLLECSTRGQHSWEADERRPMELEYRSSMKHNKPSSSSKTLLDQEETLQKEEETEEIEGLCASRMTGVLNPSLDLWANVGEGNLGDTGWVLAMVTRLRETTFTLDELKNILGLGERQIRRVIEKLGSWARKTRVGRGVLVTVNFSMLMTADEDDVQENFQTTSRRDHKARLASYEADVVREMATEAGRLAKEMWQNRVAEIRQLRAYAAMMPSRAYERLIRILEQPENKKHQKSRWEGERALRKHLGGI